MRTLQTSLLLAIALFSLGSESFAAKRILPPVGIEIPEKSSAEMSSKVLQLKARIDDLKQASTSDERAQFFPDVEIFVKAVDYAIKGRELYHPREIAWAQEQLRRAEQRVSDLESGKHPWTAEKGLVVRGFRSELDGSAQPYGLVIPKELDLEKPNPLYVWLHGRGDKTLDVQFIQQRLTSAGQIQPESAIVLHPYARYCNGYKSAGEVDVFEAIEAVSQQYKIDLDRIVLCGFSMGGAGVWHLGAHYPDRWAAISPGAGFVDVRRYQSLKAEQFPPWYEQTLWGVYDVPDYARNLLKVPLVAYSGELDKQKAAADIMEETLKGEGLAMTHIVGKGVAHKYEPTALKEVLERLHRFEEEGRDRYPAEIHFQTRTLRYSKCHWIDVLQLEEHWRDARVDAKRTADSEISINTSNVARLGLACPWKASPTGPVRVKIDGVTVRVPPELWAADIEFFKVGDRWALQQNGDRARSFIKSPGMQGPIDDAFLEPFLVVRPTGTSKHSEVDQWVAGELAHFKVRWRTLFRGEVREIDDVDVTPEMMSQYHLILWGDPTSNRVMAKLAGQLPLQWDEESIRVPGVAWPASSHVLAMIQPNPLAEGRGKYVVLNSGITFREAHDRTNSLQNPKLPDWAVIDLSVPPDDEKPGRIADAGFFDESWKYQAKRSIPERSGE